MTFQAVSAMENDADDKLSSAVLPPRSTGGRPLLGIGKNPMASLEGFKITVRVEGRAEGSWGPEPAR